MVRRLETLKLFNSPNGSNPKRVRVFLAEKGLEIPTQIIDFNALEHRTPEFRKINPMAALPVLQLEDGTYLSESYAICRYLEELHPEPALFGRTPQERAVIEMWNRRMELDVAHYVTMIIKHTGAFFAGTMTQVPAYAEACKIDLLKKYDWLNGEMAHRQYLAGDDFTVADITAFGRLGMAKQVGMHFTDQHPHLQGWWARLEARPSAKA